MHGAGVVSFILEHHDHLGPVQKILEAAGFVRGIEVQFNFIRLCRLLQGGYMREHPAEAVAFLIKVGEILVVH